MPLSDRLDKIRQRTGAQNLTTREGLYQFTLAVRNDFGNISNVWNNIAYNLFDSVAEPGLDALDKGLCGNTLWSDIDASEGSPEVFYDTSADRPRTITESFNWVSTQITSLESSTGNGGGGNGGGGNDEYEPDPSGPFPDVSNLNDIIAILSFGSGAFSVDTYPDIDGVLYLSAGIWQQAMSDDINNGAAAFKAIQRETSSGVKFMLRQGKTTIAASLFDAPPSAGDVIYLSPSNAGNLTPTAPTGAGEVVQKIGYCLSVSGSSADCYLDINDTYYIIPSP